MPTIVMKFGGTSVADLQRIENAADKVIREIVRGNRCVVVVSAMSGVTNQLVSWVNSLTPDYDAREYDAVVATGEQVTAGLMAIALQKHGIKARSWQGWQAGVISTTAHGRARIQDIEAERLERALAKGEVPVIAGFQGVTAAGRITTLGRGGSDTSAVAFAAALNADRCDIYTDVDGVYTTDPRICKDARKISRISFEEMLEMASVGAKVLQIRSVELAMKRGIKLQVLSSLEDKIGSDLPGTLLVKEEDVLESHLISGVSCSKDEAKITLVGVRDMPGFAASMVKPLADAGINIDMIVQNVTADGNATDMTFTLSSADLHKAVKALEGVADKVMTDDKVAKVSVIGIGMKAHPEVALTAFKAMADANINIMAISTSEIKISMLVSETKADDAVRALHSAFELDKVEKTPQILKVKHKEGR
ncbi:MAG: aspartate kinase [Proteobacteria bacterium]|nr:aspartate kinase [Pseudomonadota bacterium]